jgi:hypothetical protein
MGQISHGLKAVHRQFIYREGSQKGRLPKVSQVWTIGADFAEAGIRLCAIHGCGNLRYSIGDGASTEAAWTGDAPGGVKTSEEHEAARPKSSPIEITRLQPWSGWRQD